MKPGVIWAWTLSFILHGLLLYFLPQEILPRSDDLGAVEPEVLELVLEPAMVKPEERRFVEANPKAPENIPDEKQNYSFRNQQAAQENPLPLSQENQPWVEGTEFTQKILEGQFEQAAMTPSAPERQSALNASEASTATPLPPKGREQAEFMKEAAHAKMGEDGTKPFDDSSTDASGQLGGALHIYETKERNLTETAASHDIPTEAKPRPRLDPKLLVGPLMQSKSNASLRGKLAINASFSEFGEYQQQFYAAVVSGWYQDIDYYQPIDLKTRVQVRFTMQANGTVTDVKAVESTASEIATLICENAISQRKKFRAWTKEMVEVYGETREMTVIFIYQ
ncbi:MAG: Uncharacterised protein [Opitutia bacterium UBA7350]|nr:MAG: Uncharacterised protein [Opitutae bacterium UBA7350]